MRPHPKVAFPVALLAVLVACALAVAADADSKSVVPANVLLKATVAQEGAKAPSASKTYEIVVAAGEQLRLNVGMRYPIPAVHLDSEKIAVPVTSFQYQNVGFVVDGVLKLTADGKITVDGQFESSQILETPTARAGHPVIGSFSQGVHVRLTPGKPVQLHRVAETPDSAVSLTLVADLLP